MNISQLIEEKDITVCVTGHRNISLAPTDEESKKVISILLGTISQLYKKGKRRFVSGGADGVDNLFAYAVFVFKKTHPDVENIVAIPFKEQYKMILKNQNRSEEQNKEWFDFYWFIIKNADKVIYVDQYTDYKVTNSFVGKFNAQKFFKRNEFMVDISSCVVDIFTGVVADKAVGPKSGTKHCINYAIKNNKIIIHMNPLNDFKKEYIIPA